MANYRAVYMTFWSDPKVTDDFSPEDKYLYLYLLTNPHTNLCGCYEISFKQISQETGYSQEAAEKVLRRLSGDHMVISYNAPTKELLLINWYKYNWAKSDKIDKNLLAEIQAVKCGRFREFLIERYNERESVSVPAVSEGPAPKQPKVERHKHGEYGWVRLSDEEYARLLRELGEEELTRCITNVDELAQSNGNKYKWKDWNLVVRKCAREGWGKSRQQSAPRGKPSTLDSLQELHSMFREEEQ